MNKWFQRAKVSHKLMLISLFFMIPDSVLLVLLLRSINDNIHFARWEQYGNQYQRPLQELLEQFPNHALALSQVKAGTPSQDQAVQEIRGKIDFALDQLAKNDLSVGEKLQFTDEGLSKRQRSHFRAQTLRDEWEALKKSPDTTPAAEIENIHSHLVTHVRTMITHAGDTSNLILDPDLDSYYLMDVTLLALPDMQDRMAKLLALGDRISKNHGLTPRERTQINSYSTLLRDADYARVVASTQTALNEDANFYETSTTLQDRVGRGLAGFKAHTLKFMDVTERLAEQEPTPQLFEEFQAAGKEARAESFGFWDVASEEIDVLLQKRIDHFAARRLRSLILTGMAFVAALGLVTFITRSISRPLQKQAAELCSANAQMLAEAAHRRQVEAALRSAEEKYRSIFENAVEGIFRTSPDGKYMEANGTLARLYGYGSVVEMETSITDIGARLYVSPNRRAVFKKAIDQDGEVRQFESEVYRRDGTVIWISENARAVHDGQGNLLYYEGTVEDVTERKAREQELQQLHKELLLASRAAGMAEVATGVIHNVGNVLNSLNVSTDDMIDQITKSRLSHLRKASQLMAEHQNGLGEFFKTDPRAQSLPAFLTKLSSHLDEEQQRMRQELETISSHVDHIKQIVNTQQSNARMIGAVETLQPAALVEDALRMGDVGLDRNQITVERDFQSSCGVTADRHRVLQILINFLKNAGHSIQASNHGERKVLITVHEKGAECMCISVTDTGVGIPPENLRRIFQHGFTTKSQGHGFGLHSSVLAARAMRGDITVASPGTAMGATFTLELPAVPKA